MKTIWGQDFDQDLLIRGAELMKDKDSGTQKQENDEQTGDDPKQGKAGSQIHPFDEGFHVSRNMFGDRNRDIVC